MVKEFGPKFWPLAREHQMSEPGYSQAIALRKKQLLALGQAGDSLPEGQAFICRVVSELLHPAASKSNYWSQVLMAGWGMLRRFG